MVVVVVVVVTWPSARGGLLSKHHQAYELSKMVLVEDLVVDTKQKPSSISLLGSKVVNTKWGYKARARRNEPQEQSLVRSHVLNTKSCGESCVEHKVL